MAKIILIDDDVDFTAAIATVLQEAGHEVAINNDLVKAEEALKAARPDLAILDVMFPDDDAGGFKFSRTIRSLPEYKELPVIMLTAVNQHVNMEFGEGDIDETWLPITAFMNKPVDFAELKEKVAELLAK